MTLVIAGTRRAGVNYTPPGSYPLGGGWVAYTRHFSGNFWWATYEHWLSLPEQARPTANTQAVTVPCDPTLACRVAQLSCADHGCPTGIWSAPCLHSSPLQLRTTVPHTQMCQLTSTVSSLGLRLCVWSVSWIKRSPLLKPMLFRADWR